MERVLDDAAAWRERERDRLWSLFLPLGGAVVALTTYVLFNLPSVEPAVAFSIVVFAALLYIPLDGAVQALLDVLRRPVLLADDETEEDVLRRFGRLHESWRVEGVGNLGMILAYAVSGMGAFAASMSVEDDVFRYLLWLGTVVFFISPAVALVELPRRRRRKKLMKRLKARLARILVPALKLSKWPFILGFGFATFFAIESGLEQNREAGVAVGGIIGIVVLLLTMGRVWHTLKVDTSLALIRDARYRLATGEMSEEETRGVLEVVETLRFNGAYFQGDARSLRDLMLEEPERLPA